MFFQQIFLVFRTLLSVVAMVLSLLWRFPVVTILLLIAGTALTYFLSR
jgi:hypothetical protein